VKHIVVCDGGVHVHNNHGSSDEHLPPFQGTLDVAEVLGALDQHSPRAVWAMEVPLGTIDAPMEWLRGVRG
jgi:sugar phosphate isomerase/epimerase